MGTDARIRYTKMVIENSFVALLKQKPLNKITVKEICALAEINRATFYRYYRDPFDLLDQMEQEMLTQLREKVKTPGNNFRMAFIQIMLGIRADCEKYRTLFSENGDSQFPGKIFALYYQQIGRDVGESYQRLTATQQEWLYYFLAQGCCGILGRWISGGMEEDVEEVANFADRLISNITGHL